MSVLQSLSRASPAKGPEKEFGHGDRAGEGAHQRGLARGFNIDTQRGMIMHTRCGTNRVRTG